MGEGFSLLFFNQYIFNDFNAGHKDWFYMQLNSFLKNLCIIFFFNASYNVSTIYFVYSINLLVTG